MDRNSIQSKVWEGSLSKLLLWLHNIKQLNNESNKITITSDKLV